MPNLVTLLLDLLVTDGDALVVKEAVGPGALSVDSGLGLL